MRTRASSLALAATLLVPLVAAASACSGGPAAQLAKPPEFNPEGQTKCGVAKSPTRPLVVEWPSADRLALEAQAKGGIVVVRYVGCDMEVLRRCQAPGSYRYVATTPQNDRITIKDADELYATVPVHAAKLETKLEKSGQLTVAMSLVGTFEADHAEVQADQLTGDCAGATHVVTALTTGAFELFAGAAAEVGAAAGVGALGGGARSEAVRESLNRGGDPQACGGARPDDKSPPFGCGAALRVEVAPIAGAGSEVTACEVVMDKDACPRNPAIGGTFKDGWDGSATNEARCLRRAKEWFYHCGGGKRVTARFLRSGKLSREQTEDPATRCQITIPPGGCPRDSNVAGVFNDDAERSGSDEPRCMRRAKDWFGWCGGGEGVTARFFRGATLSTEQRVEPPTRCQISITECPRNADMVALFNDDAEHSDVNPARCAARAGDWFGWCGGGAPVTARYYEGATLLKEVRRDAPTRCQITIPAGGCPRSPETAGVFNDDAENAGADDARCLRRAKDWYGWCGGSAPVTARFYAGPSVQREARVEHASRCQISIAACPRDARVAGVFNDDAENSGADEARCARRAKEWDDWCGGVKTTARYYQGQTLMREQASR